MSDTATNGLPAQVSSLRAVLYTDDEIRGLLPTRPNGEPYDDRWIGMKFKRLGLRPRFLGQQRLWLKEEVERALPRLVRLSWSDLPAAERTRKP